MTRGSRAPSRSTPSRRWPSSHSANGTAAWPRIGQPESLAARAGRPILADPTTACPPPDRPHPDRRRLHRAAEHYSVALEHWQVGRELPILSHLWMCVETLTDVAIRQQCRDNNFPTSSAGIKQLAVLFGVDPEKPGELKSKVRETYLFQGNTQVYSDARKLRNAIVHGFEDFDAIRTEAHPICEATAAHLRTAIFRLAGVTPAMQETLLDAPYHQPLGSWPVAQHVWGKLEGRSETLAPEHSFFPYLEWDVELQSITQNDQGEYIYAGAIEVEAHLASGVQFKLEDFQVYNASKF